jgi:enoyl-CoA hydratase
MEYKNIIVDRYGTDNRLGRITLNRPEKLNTLSAELLSEFEDALKNLAKDNTIRVLIIRGAGRAFGAGYDLSPAGGGTEQVAAQDRFARMRFGLQDGARLQMYLWNFPKITIAQVHGYCLAGSCEYAMMCDLVIAADNAIIGHPGTRGLGHPRNSCFWPLLIGMRKTKELMYTGDQISGKEAATMGMINRAVPAKDLEKEVTILAERIAIQSADALAIHKEALNRWWQTMGIEGAVRAAADYDGLYQLTQQAALFNQKIRELGVKGAFEWRDEPYGDLRGQR